MKWSGRHAANISARALACVNSSALSCKSMDLVEALDAWTREPRSTGGEVRATGSGVDSCSDGAGDPGDK